MWGWVISKQNWNLINSLITGKFDSGIFRFPRILFQSFLFSGYYRAKNNELDALDALIAYIFSSNDFLTLVPPINLISNIGTGPLATNTSQGSTFHHAKVYPWPTSSDIHLPKPKTTRVFVHDFLIFRKMNGWKIHHLFSNYMRIRMSE
jgi:hypothetical protein